MKQIKRPERNSLLGFITEAPFLLVYGNYSHFSPLGKRLRAWRVVTQPRESWKGSLLFYNPCCCPPPRGWSGWRGGPPGPRGGLSLRPGHRKNRCLKGYYLLIPTCRRWRYVKGKHWFSRMKRWGRVMLQGSRTFSKKHLRALARNKAHSFLESPPPAFSDLGAKPRQLGGGGCLLPRMELTWKTGGLDSCADLNLRAFQISSGLNSFPQRVCF